MYNISANGFNDIILGGSTSAGAVEAFGFLEDFAEKSTN